MTGTLEGTSFTDEQVKRFQIHDEEGTDVYIDPDYIQWLELYHSESLPTDHYSLISAIASTNESPNLWQSIFIPLHHEFHLTLLILCSLVTLIYCSQMHQ